jgi:L-malate glycosyltransferase
MILHVASWYPGPWDNVEGNFIRDQIAVFRQELPGEVVVIQVRPSAGGRPKFDRPKLDGNARGYILHAPVRAGSKALEWLSTLLLLAVLVRLRAWRFDALHVHIAYPLLIHAHLWRWLLRKPIVISEHWSAYHYNFHLPDTARALHHLRRPFQQGFPVLAVSAALLDDIRRFANGASFTGWVIPNVVPLQGASDETRKVPVLFAVNRWVAVKNPIPMLEGLARAADAGSEFELVIGGYGPLIEEMTRFAATSSLHGRTRFLGKMTKPEIAAQLAQCDGYLFSSDYETFSIACAEALGAGVPLIGPQIAAIAEYAKPQDWVQVPSRDRAGWESAVGDFINLWAQGHWDRAAIAQRAAQQFGEATMRARYCAAMQGLGLGAAR